MYIWYISCTFLYVIFIKKARNTKQQDTNSKATNIKQTQNQLIKKQRQHTHTENKHNKHNKQTQNTKQNNK